jgi:N4-gp56 family major capsid protein
MALNTTTTLSNQYQRYFNKVLLDTAQHELVYNQFGAKRQLPRGVGAKDIRFFRRVAANSADVQTLAEGVPISVFKDITYTPVDATLAQIGEAAKYSDLVGWTALLDVLDDGIDLMGEDCALKADDITQAACMALRIRWAYQALHWGHPNVRRPVP